MIVEIFSNAFFHNFQSNMFMMEYELAEGLSLSKALEELLRPPTADIRFLLIEGSNMLSLFKEVDGFPAVRKDIKLQYGEFMPRPSMAVAVSNVFVAPKNFTMLYNFLNQAEGDEIAEIAFGEKNCQVSLGCLQLQAEGPSFCVIGSLILDIVVRNRLVSPRPVWNLNISLLRRLYKVVYLPTSKPLMYFGDSRVVAALKMSNGVVAARAMYLTKGLLYEGHHS
ncbi:hypothetical protein MKX03_016237 [Papaver bracteatum]|nr:hypothetical protein MKX03_016237 [Papaver bracteatum]